MGEASFNYLGVTPDTRTALTALCQEYVWRIDFGHAQTVPELFTDGGAWEGPWGVMTGQAELAEAWTRRAGQTVRTRHMLTNLRFSQVAADEALGWIGQIVFVADGEEEMRTAPSIIAENIDRYGRDSDGIWRFASRRIVILAQ